MTPSPSSYSLYWRLPRSKESILAGEFDHLSTARDAVAEIQNGVRQYIAIIKHNGKVRRYLVSRGCGDLTVIPMHNAPGWTEKQETLSNIVNFVMAREV
jgi:hypothetical protein